MRNAPHLRRSEGRVSGAEAAAHTAAVNDVEGREMAGTAGTRYLGIVFPRSWPIGACEHDT
jgi:hypothetical protein